jgi:nicotinate-nucleotide--dimethylbenzimidazole phosphoribosyltransferase
VIPDVAEGTLALDRAVAAIEPLDESAMTLARAHLDRLTKPPGSLGRLEELVILLAGIAGCPDPPIDRRRIVVAAADHGVTAQGVSAYPSSVTAQMVANFVAGGAAINALTGAVGATVTVVDVGVANPVPSVASDRRNGGNLVRTRVRDGTGDMSIGPAMTRGDALRTVGVGVRLADEMHANGLDLLGVGEMGIGNTTAAAAIVAVLTGQPPENVTGRGTGIDEGAWRRKVAVIERALAVNAANSGDPIGVLAAVGGLEIAVIVGLVLGAAGRGIPVVLDGFIAGAAALVAARLQPSLPPRLIASHRSAEPGHAVVLERLGLRPLLDLDLRLGEGTGAALAFGLIDAACRVRDGMATFDDAGVAGPVV